MSSSSAWNCKRHLRSTGSTGSTGSTQICKENRPFRTFKSQIKMKWTKIRRIRSAVFFCVKTYWNQKQKQRWANQTQIALGGISGILTACRCTKAESGCNCLARCAASSTDPIRSTTRQVWVEMVKLCQASVFCKFCKFYGRNSWCTSAAFRLKFWSIPTFWSIPNISADIHWFPNPHRIHRSTDPQIHIAPAFHRLAPPNVLPGDPGPTARTPAGQHCLARSRCLDCVRDHFTSSKWESNTCV